MPENDQGAAPARPTPRLWYMAAVLCLVNTVGFVDRQSLPLLVIQIEQDLHISDTEMSLLIGLAFVLVFSSMGIPAGMLVDRVNRRKLIAGAIALWGAATIGCAGAFSFTSLFIGRMAVGIGESVNGPGALSLIRDGFPPGSRASAIAIWAMGASIGGGLALLGGGAVLAVVADAAVVHLPLLGAIKAWQLVLIVSGLAAYPVSLLVLTIREPARRSSAAEIDGAKGMREALAFVMQRGRVFGPLFVANGVTIMMMIGFALWMPALLGRVWHLSRPEIGFSFGLVTLLFSPTSQFVAGIVVDKLERRGIARAIPIAGLVIGVAVFIPALLTPNAPSLAWTWVLTAIYTLLGTSFFTIGTAAIAKLTPSTMVGKVSSLHFFSVGVCGTAIAPFLIAAVSDGFFSGPGALGASLATVCGTLDVIAIVCYAILYKVMREPAAL
jgi:MFS family permease